MTWRERLKAFFKALPIWLALLGPVLLLTSVIITAVLDFRFLHMEASWQCILLGLAPTIVMSGLLLLGRFVRVDYCVLLSFALLGLVYSMTIGMVFTAFSMEFYSQTEDIAHYRQVDELFYWSETAEALFPEQSGNDGRYYYYCGYDGYQSLCAEWTLPPEELEAEVARVTALLSGAEGYQQVQHGSYLCHAINGGWYPSDAPFQLRNGLHSVTFFAYDPHTGVVRYILCDERAYQDDPPYYMTLDWQ